MHYISLVVVEKKIEHGKENAGAHNQEVNMSKTPEAHNPEICLCHDYKDADIPPEIRCKEGAVVRPSPCLFNDSRLVTLNSLYFPQ